jgi:N6-L-threonylcarbamoyladenine synthase
VKILAIETSCDETAAAVVENGIHVLSNVIGTSVDLHAKTGGVVPEVAAREHIRQISPILDKAMEDAKVGFDQIDAIAVTHAPGLVASLLIGVNTAQALAFIYKKPLIPMHHVAGHIYANFLERNDPIRFPIVVLTVSGGHNDLILMKGHHDFQLLGESLDDAAGEAFDKVARLLDIGFPGGPIIAKTAEKGDSKAFKFTKAHLTGKDRYSFSFSGLKTAVRNIVQKLESANEKTIADIAASFQFSIADELSDKLVAAAREFGAVEAHLAGGVSANQLLRKLTAEKLNGEIPLVFPKKLIYCTDNAAMLASAAYFLIQKRPEVLKTDWRRIEVFSQLPLSD